MRIRLWLLSFISIFSVVHSSISYTAQSVDPIPKPPLLWLPDVARPSQYDARLTVDPNKDHFVGDFTIDLQLKDKISVLWLNGTDLKITKVQILNRGITEKASVLPIENENFIGFSFKDPIGPGSVKLQIEYTGHISDKDTDGLFKMQDGDHWYAYTQFQPVSARRVFPCFDEPSYKVPWRIQITIPKDLVAVSNAPVESESEDAQMKTVHFARSKPLPSYLIAFAVGPFEFVDVGRIGKNGTPFRIVTPKGRTGETRWVAESTPQILSLLEDYFGSPYPYEKLDQIAVPKIGFAMEHPGLVTYGDTFFLMRPEDETISLKRGYASLCAHELAHMWFGDLVTMKWWDDIWLNESFASWLATKTIMRWKPEWDEEIVAVDSRSYIMNEDSLISARKIRQPIKSMGDIENSFDSITYGKGKAILQMFEAWIGEETFRLGIQEYLKQFAWGNATADDFLKAISKSSGQQVAPAFSTFLDQTGVPLVNAGLECTNGDAPLVNLQASRYLPLGSSGSPKEAWQIPICIKYGLNDQDESECILMKANTEKFPLTNARACPGWFFINKNGWGYYHVKYPEDELNKLLVNGGKVLTIAERMSLINDFNALMENGQMTGKEILNHISAILQDPNLYIIRGTSEVLAGMSQPLVNKEVRPEYARFIRNLYGAKAHELGWKSRSTDDENTKLLRKELLVFVVQKGEEKQLASQATKLAFSWLKDRNSVEPDMVGAVLRSAATYGDKMLFELYYQEAKKATDPIEREQLLEAMACFQDQDIARLALSLILSSNFDIRDSITIVWRMSSYPDQSDLVYKFVTDNFEELVARLPRAYTQYLPYIGGVYCDEMHHKEVESFFKVRMSKIPGGERNLDKTLEEIELCSALRKAQQSSVIEFLKSPVNK